MGKRKNLDFRVSKSQLVKTLARRPKGFLRTPLVHKSKKTYTRARKRADLRKMLKSGNGNNG